MGTINLYRHYESSNRVYLLDCLSIWEITLSKSRPRWHYKFILCYFLWPVCAVAAFRFSLIVFSHKKVQNSCRATATCHFCGKTNNKMKVDESSNSCPACFFLANAYIILSDLHHFLLSYIFATLILIAAIRQTSCVFKLVASLCLKHNSETCNFHEFSIHPFVVFVGFFSHLKLQSP